MANNCPECRCSLCILCHTCHNAACETSTSIKDTHEHTSPPPHDTEKYACPFDSGYIPVEEDF